jgi:prepilin-type processing-associated H-X9-DG protein
MELLVVITIIAILAALLFPVFGRMRISAESSNCASNLRNLGIEFTRYLNEEGNRVVPIAYANKDQQETFGLPYTGGFVDYYYNSLSTDLRKVVGCPTQRRNKQKIWSSASTKMALDQRRTYSLNTLLTAPPTVGEPRSILTFNNPAGTMLFGDGDNSDSGGNAGYYNSILNTARIPEPVHAGSANVVFLDGHVESIKKADIPTDKEAKVPNTPERMFWYGLVD